jgi:hypothetical protein
MQTIEHDDRPEFWADTYNGRSIAIFHRYGKWHAYLDHVLQHNMLFATPEDAIVWLTERVDQGIPGRLN